MITDGDSVKANGLLLWISLQGIQLKREYKDEEEKRERRRKVKAKLGTFKTGLKETLEKEEVGMFNFTIPFLLFRSISSH
jgi:hypothetical protein